MSTDLAAFLHARITEDEKAARRWREDEHEWQVVGRRHLTYQSGSGENVAAIDVTNQPCMWWERIYVKGDFDDLADHIARHDPARVLADCAAKHAIVRRAQEAAAAAADMTPTLSDDDPIHDELTATAAIWDQVLRLHAQPWADHPDYHPDWQT